MWRELQSSIFFKETASDKYWLMEILLSNKAVFENTLWPSWGNGCRNQRCYNKAFPGAAGGAGWGLLGADVQISDSAACWPVLSFSLSPFLPAVPPLPFAFGRAAGPGVRFALWLRCSARPSPRSPRSPALLRASLLGLHLSFFWAEFLKREPRQIFYGDC